MRALGHLMKRISTLLEVFLSVTLLPLGLYLLNEGSANKSTNEAAIQIGGAVCCTLGIMVTGSAVKSILWHRRMLRNAENRRQIEHPGH